MNVSADLATVAIDIVAWVVISVFWGTVASFLGPRQLDHDTSWTRIRSWERDGAWYRRLGIRRWKDALPESNRLGPGDRPSKRHLPSRADLPAFVAETRRAEYVHVAIAASGTLFVFWNPAWLALVMIVFGVLFNLPFIMIQRYNRLRLQRVAARSAPPAV